ncbi:hypothetical protein AACH06_22815 [Ideonella sp. DXS29W]|uniref:Uncharacterized protein n=1 Tax=Ideonella lacteola TaxID=2984193 RepID=A0ABU9BYK5_9BURK
MAVATTGVALCAAFSAGRAAAACDTLDQRVRASTVPVGGSVSPSDEYTPVVIAPRGDGTSVLAWTDRSASRIQLAKLTPADALKTSLPPLAGLEVHAALPLADGTALAVMANDPDIYSPKYCWRADTPDKAVCGKMDLVRLDTAGQPLSRTTLTEKGNVDSDGAQFIWWYGHTARLATDGSRIGVYFRSAMSTPRPGAPGEVDIHAGDTLKFVDAANGALLKGGWEWGCSHSWSVRLAHSSKRWGAACHGDAYPNAMRVSRLATPTSTPDDLQWLSGTDPARRALGGLVPSGGGFWIDYLQPAANGLELKLAKVPATGGALKKVSTIAAGTALDATYPFRPYMAAYGQGKLLLGWKASGQLKLAVADAGTGELIEGPISTTLKIDSFQDMATAPNGDVLWAYSSGGSNVLVNRVAACSLAR